MPFPKASGGRRASDARGARHIRSDNDPKFMAHALRRWLGQVGVDAMYIEPGSPEENGYAESFHGRL